MQIKIAAARADVARADVARAAVAGVHAAAVVRLHDRQLRARDWPVLSHPPLQSEAWCWIDANHRYNGLLRRERERTRRADALADEVAAGKRLIDRYAQKRSDAIEAIDDALLAGLSGIALRPDARLSSETAGAMIDRLSTLALQIEDMYCRAERSDARNGDDDQRQPCRIQIQRLSSQRQDVMDCLDALLAELRAGRTYFKIVRRFKVPGDVASRAGPGGVP